MSDLNSLPRVWYTRSPHERITHYKKGIPVQIINETAKLLKMPCRQLILILGLPISLMVRSTTNIKTLSPVQSELVVGVLCLIGQVEKMVRRCSQSDFDAADWISEWLQSPVPALGGRMPIEYLDTCEGQLLIGRLLSAAESGAYW